MTATTSPSLRTSARWRVVDIVVASVLGVASGLIFWAWNAGYQGPSALLEPVLPGLQGLTAGPWLFAGVLGGLVIRRPGAALYVELVAAFFSMLFGAQWGVDTLLSGLLQGLGAEIVFALFLYRRFGPGVAALAGAAAGLLEVPHELIAWYPGSSALFVTVFTASLVVSGAVIAGIGSWIIARALAATGALSRFAAGRERRADV
ncbi:ECF transporter S component [Galbitalea sp. SE-J8]|uniref:ECF transporter S component n=1 Tax=Galbitalea sp. SE-J8 TaxID=3054952 RepID=UPI00259C7283|nr:ECF transporter S component [Galbitalea sp. SE-J8]MDM4764182.1 ECF transporter S component [Galbitalea sp. SE-J8]